MKKSKYEKAVMESADLSLTEAMVALAWAHACDYNTGKNVCSSMGTVASRAKIARRTAIRVTQSLVAKGWLTEESRAPFTPTEYSLSVPTSDTRSLPTSDTRSLVESQVETVTSDTETQTSDSDDTTSDTGSLGGVTLTTPTSDTGSHNSKEHTKEPITKSIKELVEQATPAAPADKSAGLDDEPSFATKEDLVSVTKSLTTLWNIEDIGDIEWDIAPLFNLEEVRAAAAARNLNGEVLALALDENFKPHITEPSKRVAWAKDEVEWAEREKALADDPW